MSNLDFPDWSEARSIADEISVIGAPLLRLTKTLGHGTGIGLPAGLGQTLLNAVSVTQPGYEMKIEVGFSAGGGTFPFANLIMTWSDSASGLTVDGEVFILAIGADAPDMLPYYMSGPCRGDTLTVTMLNMDPAIAATLNYATDEISHVYLQDRLIQPNYAGVAPPGYTNPGGLPASGLLASVGASIPGSGTETRLIAAWNGKAQVLIDNTTGAFAASVWLQDPSTLYGGFANASFYFNRVAAQGASQADMQFPNGPLLLKVTNDGSASAIQPLITVTKEEAPR